MQTLPERYQLVAWLGAGLGLRQGEIFALSPDDIDFETGEVHVRRQVKLFGGNAQVFGLLQGAAHPCLNVPRSESRQLALGPVRPTRQRLRCEDEP